MTKEEARRKAKKLKAIQLTDDKVYNYFYPYLKDGMIVGMYYPMPGEINLLSLMKLFSNVIFCFPRANGLGMEFYLPNEEGFVPWYDHSYVCMGQLVSKDSMDMIIVPSLAINRHGYRLGHGRGHYDRYLSDYKGNTIAIVGKDSIIDFTEEEHDVQIKVVIEV